MPIVEGIVTASSRYIMNVNIQDLAGFLEDEPLIDPILSIQVDLR